MSLSDPKGSSTASPTSTATTASPPPDSGIAPSVPPSTSAASVPPLPFARPQPVGSSESPPPPSATTAPTTPLRTSLVGQRSRAGADGSSTGRRESPGPRQVPSVRSFSPNRPVAATADSDDDSEADSADGKGTRRRGPGAGTSSRAARGRVSSTGLEESTEGPPARRLVSLASVLGAADLKGSRGRSVTPPTDLESESVMSEMAPHTGATPANVSRSTSLHDNAGSPLGSSVLRSASGGKVADEPPVNPATAFRRVSDDSAAAARTQESSSRTTSQTGGSPHLSKSHTMAPDEKDPSSQGSDEATDVKLPVFTTTDTRVAPGSSRGGGGGHRLFGKSPVVPPHNRPAHLHAHAAQPSGGHGGSPSHISAPRSPGPRPKKAPVSPSAKATAAKPRDSISDDDGESLEASESFMSAPRPPSCRRLTRLPPTTPSPPKSHDTSFERSPPPLGDVFDRTVGPSHPSSYGSRPEPSRTSTEEQQAAERCLPRRTQPPSPAIPMSSAVLADAADAAGRRTEKSVSNTSRDAADSPSTPGDAALTTEREDSSATLLAAARKRKKERHAASNRTADDDDEDDAVAAKEFPNPSLSSIDVVDDAGGGARRGSDQAQSMRSDLSSLGGSVRPPPSAPRIASHSPTVEHHATPAEPHYHPMDTRALGHKHTHQKMSPSARGHEDYGAEHNPISAGDHAHRSSSSSPKYGRGGGAPWGNPHHHLHHHHHYGYYGPPGAGGYPPGYFGPGAHGYGPEGWSLPLYDRGAISREFSRHGSRDMLRGSPPPPGRDYQRGERGSVDSGTASSPPPGRGHRVFGPSSDRHRPGHSTRGEKHFVTVAPKPKPTTGRDDGYSSEDEYRHDDSKEDARHHDASSEATTATAATAAPPKATPGSSHGRLGTLMGPRVLSSSSLVDATPSPQNFDPVITVHNLDGTTSGAPEVHPPSAITEVNANAGEDNAGEDDSHGQEHHDHHDKKHDEKAADHTGEGKKPRAQKSSSAFDDAVHHHPDPTLQSPLYPRDGPHGFGPTGGGLGGGLAGPMSPRPMTMHERLQHPELRVRPSSRQRQNSDAPLSSHHPHPSRNFRDFHQNSQNFSADAVGSATTSPIPPQEPSSSVWGATSAGKHAAKESEEYKHTNVAHENRNRHHDAAFGPHQESESTDGSPPRDRPKGKDGHHHSPGGDNDHKHRDGGSADKSGDRQKHGADAAHRREPISSHSTSPYPQSAGGYGGYGYGGYYGYPPPSGYGSSAYGSPYPPGFWPGGPHHHHHHYYGRHADGKHGDKQAHDPHGLPRWGRGDRGSGGEYHHGHHRESVGSEYRSGESRGGDSRLGWDHSTTPASMDHGHHHHYQRTPQQHGLHVPPPRKAKEGAEKEQHADPFDWHSIGLGSFRLGAAPSASGHDEKKPPPAPSTAGYTTGPPNDSFNNPPSGYVDDYNTHEFGPHGGRVVRVPQENNSFGAVEVISVYDDEAGDGGGFASPEDHQYHGHTVHEMIEERNRLAAEGAEGMGTPSVANESAAFWRTASMISHNSYQNYPADVRDVAKKIYNMNDEHMLVLAELTHRRAWNRNVYSLVEYRGTAWYLPSIRPVEDDEPNWGVDWNTEKLALVLFAAGRRVELTVVAYFLRLAMLVVFWFAAWAAIPSHLMEHDGYVFDPIICVLTATILGGIISRVFQLPSLMCVMWVAIIWHNIPSVGYLTAGIHKDVRKTATSAGLTVILLRAGLYLKWADLRANALHIAGLAFIPVALELFAHSFMAKALFGYEEYKWAFLQGGMVAAVSPAVLVPALLALRLQGHGVTSGPPTIMLPACPTEMVLGIWNINFIAALIFNTDQPVGLTVALGPIQILGGFILGGVLGLLFFLLFHLFMSEAKRLPNKRFSDEHLSRVAFISFIVITALGLAVIFYSKKADLAGGGSVAVTIMAATVAHLFRRRFDDDPAYEDELMRISKHTADLWDLFIMPCLFAMVGSNINLSQVFALDFFPEALACLAVGLVARFIGCLGVSWFGQDYTFKEKIILALGWCSKASVQAALGTLPMTLADDKYGATAARSATLPPTTAASMGSSALDSSALSPIFDPEVVEAQRIMSDAERVSNVAFLAIMICAPLGAIAVERVGPLVIRKDGAGGR